MSKVRQAFYTALLRSLLRTKKWLQSILQFWITPPLINGDVVEGLRKRHDAFLGDVKEEFEKEMNRDHLVAFSNGLKGEFEESLLENPCCMLPSYNHQLPTGNERGTYLALDVGGSTFRVALVKLSGKKVADDECKILKHKSFKVDGSVKKLKGVSFFDWMAERIEETLSGGSEMQEITASTLSMGLSWSFPIEYVSYPSLFHEVS